MGKGDLLEASANPFAKVVLAHLKTRQTQGDPANRHAWKRGLYQQGFSAKDVRELFRIIDWMMALPPLLDESFWNDVANDQEEKRMPFITTPERVGIKRGLREGISALLKARFGEEGLKLMPEIHAIVEEEQLRTILNFLVTATTVAEVRRLWSSENHPQTPA